MNKYEYLTQLEEQLRGAVSTQEVNESVQFYRDYIEEEIRKGRSEAEVLESLGSANSIAKSIIEASGIDHDEEIVEEPGMGTSYGENASSVKVFQAQGWKGTLIIAGILIALILILVFAFKVFVALLPVLIPAAIILYVIKIAKERGR